MPWKVVEPLPAASDEVQELERLYQEKAKEHPGKKTPVGVLGATGIVGQRFIQLLDNHPWFEVQWLAASERSAGSTYANATRWKLNTPIPEKIAVMNISAADPSGAPKIIFAALDSGVAQELEPRFAQAGCAVISNSSAFRMRADVPLLIPEVNPDHIKLVEQQATWRKNKGFIATNPNCSAIGLAVALAPVHRHFGVKEVFVSTMQAVSGAGYPGVASLDILGNVVPYIGKEEEKLEAETCRLLGKLVGREVKPEPFRISAQCSRVAVEDGHTESVSVKLARSATADDLIAGWRRFCGLPQKLQLPSAPHEPIYYHTAPDRPQPRLDVNRGRGMTVSVGGLRKCNVLDWKFTVLSHNTIRGAAGAALLNAELLKAQGYLD